MKTYYRHCLVLFLLLVATLAFIADSLRAQSISGAFTIRRDSADVRLLLERLRTDQNLNNIPKSFFGKTYNEVLPNLVVFVDKDTLTSKVEDVASPFVRARLVHKGKKKEDLVGEPYLYCLVFVATDSGKDSSFSKFDTTTYKTTERNLEFSTVTNLKTNETTITHDTTITQREVKRPRIFIKLSPLDYSVGTGEFVLYRLVQGIAEKFLPISGEEKAEERQIADTTISLKLEYVGYSPKDTTHLYFGYVKIPLAENTINRVGIRGLRDYNKHEYYIYNTFGNYSDSKLTTSIGLLGTFLGSSKAIRDSTNKFIFDPFVFGHWHLNKPGKPGKHVNSWRKRYWCTISVDLVVGTKISKIDDLFNDNFVGVGIGHIVGSAGIVFGVNFRTTTNADGSKVRELIPSIGMNIFL